MEASRIAKEAGVKQLIMTHFDARRYPTIESRKEAEVMAKELVKDSIASEDDIQMEI